MNERIQPDFSVIVRLGEEDVPINRMYDNTHIFEWLGHGILKIVSQEGFLQWHTTQESAIEVSRVAGITPLYRPEITEEEYEQYLQYKEHFLNEADFGL